MRPDAHTLVAAYAVHALDEGERADVRGHLEQCDTCRDDLRAFRETAAALAAATAEAPPARMRAAVLARARATPQLPPLTADEPWVLGAPGPVAAAPVTPPTGGGAADRSMTRGTDQAGPDAVVAGTGAGRSSGTASRLGRSRAVFGLAATVLAATAVGAGGFAVVQSDRLGEVQQQQAAVQRVLSADDVVTLSAPPQLPGGVQGDEVVVLASASEDAALLLPAGLPEAPDGSTWQAWTLTGDRAVSAGTFDVSSGEAVALQASIDGADAVAVSLEPEGGSESPSTEPVLVLPLA